VILTIFTQLSTSVQKTTEVAAIKPFAITPTAAITVLVNQATLEMECIVQVSQGNRDYM